MHNKPIYLTLLRPGLGLILPPQNKQKHLGHLITFKCPPDLMTFHKYVDFKKLPKQYVNFKKLQKKCKGAK